MPLSSLNLLEQQILKYEKQGFTVSKKNKLKYGMRVFLKKGKRFVIDWAYYRIYLYYVDGDATKESINESLKDYLKLYEGEELEETKGFFIVAGSLDNKLFKDIRAAIIRKDSIRNTIKAVALAKATPQKTSNGAKETNEKRDARRAFTQSQKKEILYQQDNKCAECHKKLDPRATHFHHEEPWASGGRTKVENGRALCADCHEIVSHKDRLKKVDR